MSSCAPTFTFNFALDFLCFSHLVHLLTKWSLNVCFEFTQELTMPSYHNPSAVFQASFSLQVLTQLKKEFRFYTEISGLLASENRGVSSNAPSIIISLRGTEPDSRWLTFLYSTSHVPLTYTEASSARQPTIAPNTFPQRTIQLKWLYTAASTTWANKESHVILKDVLIKSKGNHVLMSWTNKESHVEENHVARVTCSGNNKPHTNVWTVK